MDISPSISAFIEESLVLDRKGDLAGARAQAHAALELAQAGGKPEEIARALVAVALNLHRLGHYTDALRISGEALELAPHGSYSQVDALVMLGMISGETEHLSEAEGYFRRAIDLSIEFGFPLLRYRSLNNLALAVYISRGQFDLAQALLLEALRLIQELGDDARLPYTLLALTWLYQFSGQRQKAHDTLDELSQVKDRLIAARGYHANLSALLAMDEGELEAAPPLFAVARSIAEQIGEPRLNIEERLGMCRYHRLAGNPSASRTWADEALSLTERTGFSLLHGRALIECGRACWESGDFPGAERDFLAAIEVLRLLGANFDLARAMFFRAALLHQEMHPNASLAWQEAARLILMGGYSFFLEQERVLAFPLLAAHLNDSNPDATTLAVKLLANLERVPPPPLRIQTLGTFQVWCDKRLVSRHALHQRRAGELLALLLITPGHTLATEQAAEALSPEKPPETALPALHHASSELRRALEPELPDRRFPSRYLEVSESMISLHLPPGTWMDYSAFEQAVRSGEWEKALELYRGEFLIEYRYAEWAAAWRENLAEQHRTALLAQAEAHLDQADWHNALVYARQLITLDPWNESAVLAAMRACQGLHDLSGARRYYKRLEKTLLQELGVEPQVELQAFYKGLKA